MPLMKRVAFSLGSLAVLGGAAGSGVKPAGAPNTEAVLEALNLFRNGRIDGGLKNLEEEAGFVYDTTVPAFVEPTEDDSNVNCTAKSVGDTPGLLIELLPTELDPLDIKKVLDQQLADGLEDLITQSKAQSPIYNNRSTKNLAYISSADATKVGCALTTGCGEQQDGGRAAKDATPVKQVFFCKFTDVDTTPKVTPAFAEALKARRAVISISKLTAADANTPLYPSSAPKLALSGLAVLSTVLSAAVLI